MKKPDKHISVVGESCPIPLIKISQAIGDLVRDQVLSITGDDPIFESSVRDYCEANDFEIVEVHQREGREVNILIQKSVRQTS